MNVLESTDFFLESGINAVEKIGEWDFEMCCKSFPYVPVRREFELLRIPKRTISASTVA